MFYSSSELKHLHEDNKYRKIFKNYLLKFWFSNGSIECLLFTFYIKFFFKISSNCICKTLDLLNYENITSQEWWNICNQLTFRTVWLFRRWPACNTSLRQSINKSVKRLSLTLINLKDVQSWNGILLKHLLKWNEMM